MIPASIRSRHKIEEGDGLVWLDEGAVIRVVPVTSDPIDALAGIGRGEGLLDKLLEERRRDTRRDP